MIAYMTRVMQVEVAFRGIVNPDLVGWCIEYNHARVFGVQS